MNLMFSGPISIDKYIHSHRNNDNIAYIRTLMMILNPYRINQAGIMLSYLDVGIIMNFFSSPITYYMIKDLNISSKSFSAYITFKKLPWTFKFIMGLILDKYPIFGYKRKSWMLIGWIILILTCFQLTISSRPSFRNVAVSMFIMTCAYILVYVACDTLVVERAKL